MSGMGSDVMGDYRNTAAGTQTSVYTWMVDKRGHTHTNKKCLWEK